MQSTGTYIKESWVVPKGGNSKEAENETQTQRGWLGEGGKWAGDTDTFTAVGGGEVRLHNCVVFESPISRKFAGVCKDHQPLCFPQPGSQADGLWHLGWQIKWWQRTTCLFLRSSSWRFFSPYSFICWGRVSLNSPGCCWYTDWPRTEIQLCFTSAGVTGGHYHICWDCPKLSHYEKLFGCCLFVCLWCFFSQTHQHHWAFLVGLRFPFKRVLF